MADVRGLVTTTVLNTKLSEVENKIQHTSSSLTTTVLIAKIGKVENKFHNHNAHITTKKYNKLTAEDFKEQADLISKNDFDNKLLLRSEMFAFLLPLDFFAQSKSYIFLETLGHLATFGISV